MGKRAKIVSQIATDEAMRKGVYVMLCEVCEWRCGLTPEIVSRYERDGLPEHCGKPVKIARVGDIRYEKEN